MVRRFPSWLGKLLTGYRPGIEKTVFHDRDFSDVPADLVIQSSAFNAANSIPKIYTDDGDGISPPLQWSGVPAGALCLVLIVEDADSPTPTPFVHLIAWDIPASTCLVEAGRLESKSSVGDPLKIGRNGLDKCQYTPPDPLPGHGEHRYLFQLFALNQPVHFSKPPNKVILKSAMLGRVLSKGCLTGTYGRL